jgi:transformation/transcription domain-associated protein
MFLGKSYNAWHTTAFIMELHVMLFPHETSYYEVLTEIYHILNEEDLHYGLWKKKMNTPEIRARLSLVQQGY